MERTLTDFEHILFAVDDRVALITLNNPERRNALSIGMRRELIEAVLLAEGDDDVSVVLIDGAGSSFCSGYDLAQDQGEAPPNGWLTSPKHEWMDQFARSCLRDWLTIWDLVKPVVVKVHGYCMAGGTEL